MVGFWKKNSVPRRIYFEVYNNIITINTSIVFMVELKQKTWIDIEKEFNAHCLFVKYIGK